MHVSEEHNIWCTTGKCARDFPFTADHPLSGVSMVATFADDTAILTSHRNPNRVSHILQTGLNET